MNDKATLCKHCDHFVDENTTAHDIIAKTNTTITVRYRGGSTDTLSRYVHCENGEGPDFDHDAEPGETRDDWETHRPDLFVKHTDCRIGPNSKFHVQSGKLVAPRKATEPCRCAASESELDFPKKTSRGIVGDGY